MLLRNNIISFLGSDAHRVEKRNTDLTGAAAEITRLAGADKAPAITTENAGCILTDGVFYPPLPERNPDGASGKKVCGAACLIDNCSILDFVV